MRLFTVRFLTVLVSFCVVFMQTVYAGDTTSLVSVYLLNDSDGTTTIDSFGSNNLTENGTIVEDTTCVFADCSECDAAGDFWNITDASQTGLDSTSHVSMTAQVYQSNWGNANRVAVGKGSAGYVGRFFTDGTMIITLNGTSVTGSTGTLSINTWTGVAWVFDDTNNDVEYHINGSVDTTITSVTAAPTDSAVDFTLMEGNASWGDWCAGSNAGSVDEVSVFTRVLTSAETTDIDTSGLLVFITPVTDKFFSLMLFSLGLGYGRYFGLIMKYRLAHDKPLFASFWQRSHDTIVSPAYAQRDLSTVSAIINEIRTEFGATNVEIAVPRASETRVNILKNGQRVTTYVLEWQEILLPDDPTPPRSFSLVNQVNKEDAFNNWVTKTKAQVARA